MGNKAINGNNIVLIGMPGAGKSTIGVVLAKTLGMRFLDTDLVIQEREESLLQDIIDGQGMETFLDKEEQAILSLEGQGNIIATGGSVVYRDDAMKHLQKLGTIIYLDVAFDEINRRVNNITTRGIAIAEGKTLRDVYEERYSLYAKYYDVKVDCNTKTVEQIIDEIIGRQTVKGLRFEVNSFEGLANIDLYNMIRLREAFVASYQYVPRLYCDDIDLVSSHLLVKDKGTLIASLRVVPIGELHDEISIDRIIIAKSHSKRGIAVKMINIALDFIRENYGDKDVAVSALVNVAGVYEHLGFIKDSDVFLVDGIEHVKMLYKAP